MLWKFNHRHLDLSERAHLMGILNVTPDSFSDGGKHNQTDTALIHARQMIAEGASIIDIGGESTRPGSQPVTAEEEIARTIPIIRALRAESDIPISIDTTKASVAAAALDAGADIINDISGLTMDPEMPAVCAKSTCGIVVMHMRGTPQTMQTSPTYHNVVSEIKAFFHERLQTLTALSIDPERLCFDPGIGFGKNLSHNLALLRHLDTLAPPKRPLLLGISRKSFIGKILETPDITDREWPTIALTAHARDKNIMLHRVHRIRENLHALRMTEAIIHDNRH